MNPGPWEGFPRLVIEYAITRNRQTPLEGDWNYGWTCHPEPPQSDAGWHIFDSSRDYKTKWRRVSVHWRPGEAPEIIPSMLATQVIDHRLGEWRMGLGRSKRPVNQQ
jgi:hypothetical protein